MRCGASDVLDAENGLMKNTTMFTRDILFQTSNQTSHQRQI
jgi:hypothetical protein